MPVRRECRHYSTRSMPSGETVQRCRLSANTDAPFSCPDDCLFFESRSITATGWEAGDGDQ
jgi:hypothetical protein